MKMLQIPDMTTEEFKKQFHEATNRALKSMFYAAAEVTLAPLDPVLGFLMK